MSLSSELNTINLKAKEGIIYPVKLNAVRKSALLSKFIKNLSLDKETDDVVEIFMPNVGSIELKKVIEFLEEHVDDDSTLVEYVKSLQNNKLSLFDRALTKLDQPFLMKLFMASDYLGIEMLKYLIGWAIAQALKGKTTAKASEYWKITKDRIDLQLKNVHYYGYTFDKRRSKSLSLYL